MTVVNIPNRCRYAELSMAVARNRCHLGGRGVLDESGTEQMRPDLLAFAAACAFFGAALYINIVEQPARLALDARSIIREWTPSNRRGFVMLAVLAIVSAMSGYGEYAHTSDVRWLIGGAIILANWPYAYFVISPLNNLLYGIRQNAPPSIIRELVRDWGLLEWGQTAIGLSAACILGWALVTPVLTAS